MPSPPRIARASSAICERLPHAVEFADADLRRGERTAFLQPAEVQGEQHALLVLDEHVGELGLDQLRRADRLAEHVA